MKNLLSIFVLGALLGGLATSLDAQESQATTESTTEATIVRLDGLVKERKKYSFTIERGGTTYSIKLASNAVIGLKMNKPWIDWEKQVVVVDVVELGSSPEISTAESAEANRVAIPLPAERLFLISNLGDAAKMKQTMKPEIKRINFYLVTPDDPGEHLPTKKEPYLSGELTVNEGQTFVNANEESIPVRLGFRYATMNGFSIAQLQPGKVQVFLTGKWNDGENNIIASRILFQPVVDPSSIESDAQDSQVSQTVK